MSAELAGQFAQNADPAEKMLLVIGSAHLDILSRATHRDDVRDRIGRLTFEFGGTAGNIAINLANSGYLVRFATAMNYSSFSRITLDYLKEAGVQLHVHHRADLPTAGFSAHVDTKGELFSAISSMPVEEVDFQEEFLQAALVDVNAVVLDCNLSVKTLNQVVTWANEMGIPVYVSAVSEEKSLRIAQIDGQIKGVFMNSEEYAFFCREIFDEPVSVETYSRKFNRYCVVTKNRHGTKIGTPAGEAISIPPPDMEDAGTRLGMGDALAAGIIGFHEIEGVPFEEAALTALPMAAQVGSSNHCHQGGDNALDQAINQIKFSAEHDPLTGVLNRNATEKALVRGLERPAGDRRATEQIEALSVLILDIDHFKRVNDTLGHQAGDGVIIRVAELASSCLRESDTLGRWGGEEFVVVLPSTSADAALVVAERIRYTIEAYQGGPCPVTVSIGVSTTSGTAPIGTLLEQADKALYQAKHSGRNCCRHFDTIAGALEQSDSPASIR